MELLALLAFRMEHEAAVQHRRRPAQAAEARDEHIRARHASKSQKAAKGMLKTSLQGLEHAKRSAKAK